MKTRKNILIIGILIFSSFVVTAREKKAKVDTAAFNRIVELVKSKIFYITLDDAFPSGNSSIVIDSKYGKKTIGGEGHVSLAMNQGEIFLMDTIATGKLPFFGRAYSVPYGEGGGIEFEEAKLLNESLKVIQKRKKQFIMYSFQVRNRNDIFSFYVEIYSNGHCSVKVNSNKRASISYSGKVSSIPEDKKAIYMK